MPNDPLELDPDNPLPPARGTLLVGGPFLSDPYFRRSVVLLCAHDEEGSFGFVLNRRIDMKVDDLLKDMPHVGSRVGIGGPVESSSLFYLHTLGPRIEGSVEVVDEVRMGGDIGQLRAVLTEDPKLAKHVRFFVGYSGWDAGQLTSEMDRRSWLVHPADRKTIMGMRETELWKSILRGMGPEFSQLANFPEDPSLN